MMRGRPGTLETAGNTPDYIVQLIQFNHLNVNFIEVLHYSPPYLSGYQCCKQHARPRVSITRPRQVRSVALKASSPPASSIDDRR